MLYGQRLIKDQLEIIKGLTVGKKIAVRIKNTRREDVYEIENEDTLLIIQKRLKREILVNHNTIKVLSDLQAALPTIAIKGKPQDFAHLL